MAYDRRLLNPDEQILLDTRLHWSFVSPQLGLVIALTAAVAAINGFDPPEVLKPLGLVVIAAAGLNFIYRCWQWVGINFVLTSQRLIFQTGIFSKFGIELDTVNIETVSYDQSLFERLVGSGTITIESAGELGYQDFYSVDRPDIVQYEILQAVQNTRSRREPQS